MVWAAHLRSKVPACDIRRNMRGFLATCRRRNPTWRPIWESSWQTARERGKSARKRCVYSTQRGLQFLRGESSRTGRASYLRKAAEGEGEMPRGTYLRGGSQNVYLSRAIRGVRAGIGRGGRHAENPRNEKKRVSRGAARGLRNR
jgi:hypothetical protein